jgi:Tfp pilus assembly protein PilV
MRAPKGKKNERGFSILEAVFASFIMIVGIGGLMALFTIAAVKNAGQGDQATRCTEYAQDKMEQLLALSYSDVASNVVGATTQSTGGVGLTTTSTCNLTPASPTTNYVDYVSTGELVSGSSAGALYVREWCVQSNANNTKTITVTVTSLFTATLNTGLQSMFPSTTLIAVKESY